MRPRSARVTAYLVLAGDSDMLCSSPHVRWKAAILPRQVSLLSMRCFQILTVYPLNHHGNVLRLEMFSASSSSSWNNTTLQPARIPVAVSCISLSCQKNSSALCHTGSTSEIELQEVKCLLLPRCAALYNCTLCRPGIHPHTLSTL